MLWEKSRTARMSRLAGMSKGSRQLSPLEPAHAHRASLVKQGERDGYLGTAIRPRLYQLRFHR